jgi:hypothetical protein
LSVALFKQAAIMHAFNFARCAALCWCFALTPAFADAVAQNLPAQADQPGVSIAKMPTFNAETLDERKLTLPRDLPGSRTLLLISFAQAQEKNVDTWITGLALTKSSIAWSVIPVIDKQNAFVQAMISGAMRMGTSDPNERDRTVALFTSQNDFVTALRLTSGKKINYAAVVDRAGDVWAVAAGDYSAEKAAPLLAALGATAAMPSK